MEEGLDNTSEKLDRDEKGRLLPNQPSLNPKGRPKRSWSIKDKFWQKFDNDPEELRKFMGQLITDYPNLVWQMLEGSPKASLEVKEDRKTPADRIKEMLDARNIPNEGRSTEDLSQP